MVITDIMCERSTNYRLSNPFKNIVLVNAHPWTSLQFHLHPSKPEDGSLQCISFDLWCKNCISFDQSCKECISCERDAQHLDGRAGRKARGKCRVHPRSSSIEIQLSGCGEVQVQVQIQALVLVQVQLLGASTSTWCKYKCLVQVQLPGASTSQKQINRNTTWWRSNVAMLWSGCSWARCTLVVAVSGPSVNSFAGFFPTCLPCTYRCPRVLEWGWCYCWPYWCKKYLDGISCTNICSMNIDFAQQLNYTIL